MKGLGHKPHPHFRIADAAGEMPPDIPHGTRLLSPDRITVRHQDIPGRSEHDMVRRYVGQSQHGVIRIDGAEGLTQISDDREVAGQVLIGEIPTQDRGMPADSPADMLSHVQIPLDVVELIHAASDLRHQVEHDFDAVPVQGIEVFHQGRRGFLLTAESRHLHRIIRHHSIESGVMEPFQFRFGHHVVTGKNTDRQEIFAVHFDPALTVRFHRALRRSFFAADGKDIFFVPGNGFGLFIQQVNFDWQLTRIGNGDFDFRQPVLHGEKQTLSLALDAEFQILFRTVGIIENPEFHAPVRFQTELFRDDRINDRILIAELFQDEIIISDFPGNFAVAEIQADRGFHSAGGNGEFDCGFGPRQFRFFPEFDYRISAGHPFAVFVVVFRANGEKPVLRRRIDQILDILRFDHDPGTITAAGHAFEEILQQSIGFIGVFPFVNQSGRTIVTGSGNDLENLQSGCLFPTAEPAGEIIGKDDPAFFPGSLVTGGDLRIQTRGAGQQQKQRNNIFTTHQRIPFTILSG